MISTYSPKLFTLPHDSGVVPDNEGGIYFFCFRFPSDYELGISNEGEWDYNRFRGLLKKIITNFFLVRSRGNFKGHLKNKAADHLRLTYSIDSKEENKFYYFEIIDEMFYEDIPYEDLIEKISIFREFFFISDPIYVGMTSEQSFRKRLRQHLEYNTNFSSTLKDLRISWSNFYFGCFPLKNQTKSEIRKMEKLIHYVLKPSLSKS